MKSRSRPLMAATLAAGTLALPAMVSTSASATPGAAKPGPLTKVIVALDAPLTDDLAARLTDLGVVRGLELRTINAVAVTAPASVVAAVADLPGVRAESSPSAG